MRSRAHRPSRIALAGVLLLVTSIASAPGSSVASTDCVTDPDPARQTQIKSGHVLFAGNIAEVAIRPNAAFGSTIPNATLQGLGFHPTSSGAGLLADRNRDGCFDAIDGEFFMPGTAYEGWALRVGSTTAYNNHTNTSGQISGTFSGLEDGAGGGTHRVTWTSDPTLEGLVVTKVIRLADGSQRVQVDVTLENPGDDAVDDIYYGRGVDPDNDSIVVPDSDFVTLVEEATGITPTSFSVYRSLNTVVANPTGAPDGPSLAQVSAAFPGGATLTLIADDLRARASRQFFSFDVNNLDLTDTWSGTASGAEKHTTEPGNAAFGDNGMNMTFNIGTILGGDSTSFTYSYTLSDTDAIAAGGSATGSAPPPLAPASTSSVLAPAATVGPITPVAGGRP